MDSESLCFSKDLSSVVTSFGDRLVRFGVHLSAPEVLLSVSGCFSLEDSRAVFPVDGSSPVRVSSFLFSSQDLGQVCQGGDGSFSDSSVLASEALVSASSSSLGGFSKSTYHIRRKLSDIPLGTLTIPDWFLSESGVSRSFVIPLLPL